VISVLSVSGFIGALWQGNECYVYTDLTSAKPQYSAGLDYSFYSRPIDLRTGPMYRRPSLRGDIDMVPLAAVSGVPQQTYPLPSVLQQVAGRGGQASKCAKKTTKRSQDGDSQQTNAKKTSKQNANKSNFYTMLTLRL